MPCFHAISNFVRIRLFIKQQKMYAKWRWQFTDETNCYSIDYPILSCSDLLYPSCLFFLSLFTSLNIAFHVKLSCFTWNLLFSCEISRLRSHCSFESGRKCCASFGQICPFFQVKIAALPDAVHPLGSLICQDTFQVRVRLLWLVIATLSLSSHKIGQSDPKKTLISFNQDLHQSSLENPPACPIYYYERWFHI